jgi:hypothetical protein
MDAAASDLDNYEIGFRNGVRDQYVDGEIPGRVAVSGRNALHLGRLTFEGG